MLEFLPEMLSGSQQRFPVLGPAERGQELDLHSVLIRGLSPVFADGASSRLRSPQTGAKLVEIDDLVTPIIGCLPKPMTTEGTPRPTIPKALKAGARRCETLDRAGTMLEGAQIAPLRHLAVSSPEARHLRLHGLELRASPIVNTRNERCAMARTGYRTLRGSSR